MSIAGSLRTRSTYGLGSPHASETTRAPAASAASRRSSGGHSSRMLTWNGFDVRDCTSSSNAAMSTGFVQLSAIEPGAREKGGGPYRVLRYGLRVHSSYVEGFEDLEKELQAEYEVVA